MAWVRSQGFSQNAQFTVTLVASTQATLGSPVAVGDLILLGTTVGANPSGLSPTVTDNLGNVYTRLLSAAGGQLFDTTGTQGAEVFICIVTVAGTPTITYKPDTANQKWMGFKGSHFTGSTASSSRRDSKGVLQTNPGTGANAITTASVAAQSGDLLWASGGCPGSAVGATEVAGTGFTASAIDATTTLIDEWNLTPAGAGAATLTDATNGAGNRYMTVGLAITPSGSYTPFDLAHSQLHQTMVSQ